ncbi:mitochondrial large subunit ribosomal protein-domain-containing protein [Apiospora arundinis]|uniref:Large ribosomal subunit protein mL49 n=1 Tax=Apiospora arundinis TaxID=335852 RepID=A0ABR2I0C8_9PEZI
MQWLQWPLLLHASPRLRYWKKFKSLNLYGPDPEIAASRRPQPSAITMSWRTLTPLRAATTVRLPFAAHNAAIPVCARFLTTATTQTPSQAPIATPSELSSAPASQQARSTPNLPYFVGRTHMNSLAVYHRQTQGTRQTTLLKKGEGNLQALKQDIAQALDLPPKDVKVGTVTGHILIKGHKREELVAFLQTLGF